MMQGEPEHPRLAEHGARLLGPAATEPSFDLVDLGARPALVPGGTTAVRGEVYALSTPHLAQIDVYEGHPLRYRRGAVRLDDGRVVEAVPDRRGSGARAKAHPHRRLADEARPHAARRGSAVVPLGQRNERMSTPRSSSPRSRRLFMTSLLALSMLTACQRGCSRKGGRNGASSRATDTGAVSQPPKAPPGVQPVLRYVQQRLEGGKFITPLAPPDPAPQASNEPALPDLPPIGKHRRIPAPAAPAGNHPCGAVQVDDEVIPLDCVDPDYLHIEHATRPLVTYRELHGGEMVLPRVVNHREEGTEGATRAQGGSLCCTAFSLASAVDYSYARWTGAPGAVSVMQVWGAYHFPSMNKARATLDLALGKETDWPFEMRTANSWMDPAFCRKQGGSLHGVPCGREPDRSRMKLARVPLGGRDHRHRRPPGPARHPVDEGEDRRRAGHLDRGEDRRAPLAEAPPGQARVARRPASHPQNRDGGHAMLLVGYATLPHSTYFLIHNSWGKHWADGGYAWIDEDTLKKFVGSAYVVDAQPAETVRSRRPPRKREHVSCAGGTLPDSISAECVPLCPDGSPRHNGVCPIAGQCAKGYVNLTGTCVRAAPTSRGRDAGAGVSWSCGPGGCAYEVATGTGGCNANVCMVSCPAPDYRLAHGRRGLTCVE